jgi:type IV pilus assembly protein PilW
MNVKEFNGHNPSHRRICRIVRGMGPSGFSLVELLIAMAVGMVILAAMFGLFTIQNKQLSNQDVITEMQQNARMAVDIVTREVRMAGYNPNPNLTGTPLAYCTGTTTTTATCVGIKNAAANTISFTADLNANGSLTAGTANPNENLVFDRYLSSGIYALGRTSNGVKQPVIEHLDLLSFSYLDANGSTTTNLANIREVQITIRTIASKMDPAYPTNGGYRTYTLTSRVAVRNLPL